MGKGYIIAPGPDGKDKKFPFVQVDKQKYVTCVLWLDSVIVNADSFQWQPAVIVMPSYNTIKLQDIYTVAYFNRAGGTSIVPDLTYFTISGDNSAGYQLEAPHATVSLDPIQSRMSLKGDTFMQNLGMRFTRDTVTVVVAAIKESGLLIGDTAILGIRFVFEDVDS